MAELGALAAVGAAAAITAALGWRRSRRAYQRDVGQLARALADLAADQRLRPVLRRIK